MKKLTEIAHRAVADYGFRQIVQWSSDDIIDQWELSPAEGDLLKGEIKQAREGMPVPVEPGDLSGEQQRLTKIIREGLS